jgi:RND family efflux transporter MFP subunit
MHDTPPAEASPPEGPSAAPAGEASVEVVYPRKGDMDRTTTQPGSVQAFESVDLYAGVSGYLKTQAVDYGSRVKKGDVLATVDVPDLDKQVERDRAGLDQARARVRVAKAQVTSARADLEAAKAAVTEAEATAKSKKAELRFREQQLRRMQDLFRSGSIDERLVDEKTEQRDAAVETENSAVAAIATARAKQTAADAKIEQANADVKEAEAEVGVAQARLDKDLVLVQFARITAPFDGVVTRRNFFPHDYVRGADEGGAGTPLVTVQRTDRFRVVVQVPDRDVPSTHPGNAATVEIDALAGKSFPAKVARIAQSEDPDTRLMHVEIDLLNPTGEIYNGMYGRASIKLDRAACLKVPSSCLVGKTQAGKGTVYVVRDGKAHLTQVEIGADNGIETAIIGGLPADAPVVTEPGAVPEDGAAVAVAQKG